MGCAGARPWAAPGCRLAKWCAPRCVPGPNPTASNAVPAPDTDAKREVTGGFPAVPVPKAALVTGGARRIGRALVLALAEAGYAVAIHHHASRAEAAALAAEITGAGGRAITLAADLADETAVKKLVPQAAKSLGPIGVLVNNASIFGNDTAERASRQSWDAHMAVNLRAPFVLTQEFAALLPPEAA